MKTLSQALITWYRRHRRALPWRVDKDPYKIWISEIMLQQTRVAAVIPYYEKFLKQFPDAEALAAAPEEELLAAWAGLGYYSRARNLQRAARQVVEAGGFPTTFEGLRDLSGIGEYTAAAIGSIAFDLPEAVLDGNVLRVMARIQGDDGDIRAVPVRKRLRQAAQNHLDPRHPGDYNQAMMELGATLCLPRDPQCLLCPVRDWCQAYRDGRQQELPVKSRGAAVERIARTAYVILRDGELLLWRRGQDSAKLAGFWELPEPDHAPRARRREQLGSFRHSITNHDYRFEVWRAEVAETPAGCEWVSLDTVAACPLSTSARKGLRLAADLLQPGGGGCV